MTSSSSSFAERLRSGGSALGYWVVIDSPVSTERLALTGYDYVALDGQHGLLGYSGLLAGLIAIEAAHGPAGVVRVEANNATPIGRALDAGAAAVIVPLVNTPEDAAAAVAATRYPPAGIRSYGPMRSGLRIGPTPAEADRSVLVFAMIETPQGLANVEAIAAVPGLDGLYVGPSDLTLALGGTTSTDTSVASAFDDALARVLDACATNGIIPGIHSASGDIARERLDAGFRFVSIASDLTHLEAAARSHLSVARGGA
ncbi:MAG: aldolase/citrate lyase family protein [Candidatus Microbacterium phytovorans]|uniref:Aldolase/citrate lyase family protein n=1 Tax=Candidatus Microbacterium phytovorans TaxID=3121374 RepID=A0AAJ5W240_9MICO|nr:aldolase/citrate lyase family protein [Microbacterium sp.]WEK13453.1 MAG: aldolase/citrate lyase family protein [Microbacterium sp.]